MDHPIMAVYLMKKVCVILPLIGEKGKFTAEETFKYDEEITIVVYTYKGKGCEDITMKEK